MTQPSSPARRKPRAAAVPAETPPAPAGHADLPSGGMGATAGELDPLERYANFYDFSPSGFISPESNAAIVPVNISGAQLLGLERSRCKGQRFVSAVYSTIKLQMSDKKRLAADLLGKIVLSRFLEIPLRAFDQLVKKGEQSPQFDALKSALTVRQLPGAQTARQVLPEAQRALGHAVLAEGDVTFFHHSESYGREYLFDEEILEDILSRSANSMELTRLVRHLRLINTRNRISCAIVRKLIETQADYVRSANPLALRPFSQAQVSAALRAEAGIEVIVDAGRISRLIRKLSIILPGGKEVDLRSLCPKPRQVHYYFVDHVIKNERALMMEGIIRAPLKDGEIAAEIGKKFAARLSRRSVAYIRHDLGIPDYRDRGHKGGYLTATTDFSSLLPLTRQSVLAGAPSEPGVYEIRTQDVQTGVCSVVYIGSAGDLRKRLGDHLRGSSGNPALMQIISTGAKFRYRLVCDGWRALERHVYLAFCTTFGVPPACNRMSP